MLYKIDDKNYVKTAKYYTEVKCEYNSQKDIILLPTKNRINVEDVKRDYSLISIDEIKKEFIDSNRKKQFSKVSKNTSEE